MSEREMRFEDGAWLNPPAAYRLGEGRLEVEAIEGTDFWRQTHYGFVHDTGHALLFDMPARFAAEITFSGPFREKYEQAGLLLWEDETRWVKAGIEVADGRPTFASVVTRERSDWAMAPADASTEEWTLRLTATDSAVILHIRVKGGWQILRVADFVAQGARLGPMVCAPLSAGLNVTFRNFRVGPVPEDPLYLNL